MGDCTRIADLHHVAQCASPLRSERKRGGGANEVPGRCGGILRVVEVHGAGHGLHANGVVIHNHGREGDRAGLLVRRPRGGRLDCVKDLYEGLEGGESFAADVALSC